MVWIYITIILLINIIIPHLIGGLLYLLCHNVIDRRWYRGITVIVCDKIWFLPQKFSGITFGIFVFIRNKLNSGEYYNSNEFIDVYEDITNDTYRQLVNHERRHSIQQLMGGIFFVIYILNFLYNYLRTFNFIKSYQMIWFERDAVKYSIMSQIWYYRRLITRTSRDTKLVFADKNRLMSIYTYKINNFINQLNNFNQST